MGVKDTGRGQIFSIRVKYCGGCNPEIDRENIIMCLQRLLEAAEYQVQFETARKKPHLLLRINGCCHACLDEQMIASPEAANRCISVKAVRLNDQPVSEEILAYAVWGKIRNMHTDYLAGRNAESKEIKPKKGRQLIDELIIF